MDIEFYQIDAFTNEVFKGNPAGVCPLDKWISEDIMQNIAFENNLSETAFYTKTNNGFDIRFFSPTTEINLCGHATLATAFVEFIIKKNSNSILNFNSKGGLLKVERQNELLQLNFPITNFKKIPITNELKAPFNFTPIEAFETNNHKILIFEDQLSIENLNFDLTQIAQIDTNAISVTAKGNNYDFVSRFFAPKMGINEDPVTGSAHTFLAPLWSQKLNKKIVKAKQVSPRGGELLCEVINDRVLISGSAKLYLKGTINIDD